MIKANFITRLFALVIWVTFANFFNVAGAALPGTISGKVIDSIARTPISLATVKIVELGRVAETDPEGEFSFANVPAGTYSIEVVSFGYRNLKTSLNVSIKEVRPLEILLVATPSIREEVIITASGQPESAKDLSQSAAVLTARDLSTVKGVGMDEVLNAVPGVKAESQAETQEVRISIRGRGINTSFGVRSIRMLVDGIPESDSTGETSDLIGIDLDSAHVVEIVKGPMAAQYGASSSGVINVITAKGSPAPFILAKTLFGNYNFWKNQVELSGTQKKTAYLVDFTRTSSDGYREHAKMRTYRLNNRVDLQLDRQTVLTFLFRTADTDSQLPGNLSASNVAADRRQASFLFKLFDAQSNISRAQFGTLFNRHWGDAKSLSATFYVRHIGFEVPVPFVFLNGRRNSFGGDARFSLRQSMRKAQNTMIFGTSLQHDHEVRKDFNNVAGSKGTSVQRDETRRLLNTGFFFLDSFKATEKLDFRAALNYSRVRIQIDDFLLGDGNDSGKRLFEKLSYQFGTTYHLAPTFSLYGSISSGFDPPTITEIGRSPIGSGGLNPDLRPEISNNYEVGGLYTLAQKAFLNFALFRLKVHDQIVPTGIGFPQETFTNAAQSINNGLEVGGGVNILKDLNLRVGYTYSDFHYRTFINGFGDSSGNTIPGIPTNRFFGNLTYFHRSGFFGGIEGQAVGKIFVNDSNTVANDSYEVANWYAGYERNLKRLNLKLLYRMNNLFNEKYSAYIVVNDRFGGYFYPSPTRNNFGMVSVTWYF